MSTAATALWHSPTVKLNAWPLGLNHPIPANNARSVGVRSGESETSNSSLIDSYRRFNEESQKQAILFSNDHGFVERSIDTGAPAQVIQFPVDVSRTATGSWARATELLYYFAVLFGVVVLPEVTVYDVWNGKDGRHWQHEQLDVDWRSPKVETQLERDLASPIAVTVTHWSSVRSARSRLRRDGDSGMESA